MPGLGMDPRAPGESQGGPEFRWTCPNMHSPVWAAEPAPECEICGAVMEEDTSSEGPAEPS